MKCADSMLKSCMLSTRIDKVGKTKLPDPSETLKKSVLNDLMNEPLRNLYKAVNRIIDDLWTIQLKQL